MGLVLQIGQALMPVVATDAKKNNLREIIIILAFFTCGTGAAAGPDRGLGGVNAETGFGMKFCI